MEFFYSNAFFSVIMIWFWAVIMPGADMFLVIRTAVSKGKQCGYFASLGIVIGTLVWLIVGFFFIKALSKTSFFEIVQVVGGGYLCFMAWQIFLSLRLGKTSVPKEDSKSNEKPMKSLIYGVFTNLSNPKPPIFVSIILSKIPQSLSLEISFLLLLMMTIIPLIWFCFVVRIFSIEKFFGIYMRFSKGIDFVAMCVFGIFGISLIIEGITTLLG